MCAALLPDEAEVERVPCSSPGHAARPDRAAARHRRAAAILLLGHLDTVIAHAAHQPLARDGDKLVGSGAVDMKGGVVLVARRAARARRAPAGLRRGGAAARVRRGVADRAVRAHRALRRLGRVPVLRGRRAHADGEEGVVVRRKAAGTLRVNAQRARRPLRLGARPRAQRAARARRGRAGGRRLPRPRRPGPAHRRADRACTRATRSTSCPARGELICDMRADDAAAFDARDRGGARRARRRDARPGAGPPVAGDGLERGDRPAARAGDGRARPDRPPAPAAAPATRATSPPPSR